LKESVEKDFLGEVGGARRVRALDATLLGSLGRWAESVDEKSSMDMEFCRDNGVAQRLPDLRAVYICCVETLQHGKLLN
jgi:hypothetical protein